MNKQAWLHWAEVVDSLRIIPRLFLGAWTTFTMVVGYQTLHWFFLQPANARGFEEASVVVGVFTAALGMVKLIYTTYSENSRDWNAQPASMTATTLVKSTTTTGAT